MYSLLCFSYVYLILIVLNVYVSVCVSIYLYVCAYCCLMYFLWDLFRELK